MDIRLEKKQHLNVIVMRTDDSDRLPGINGICAIEAARMHHIGIRIGNVTSSATANANVNTNATLSSTTTPGSCIMN